jgi:hypothetical protein
MEYTPERLNTLREELYVLSKQANEGTVDRATAADKIIDLRSQIDELLKHLSKAQTKSKRYDYRSR